MFSSGRDSIKSLRIVFQTPEFPALFALIQPLWPDQLTEEVAGLVCNLIRLDGIADHLAAAMMGVTRTTVIRWKESDEGFALKLDVARALFEQN